MTVSTMHRRSATENFRRWRVAMASIWVFLWALMLFSSSLTHAHACCEKRHHEDASAIARCDIDFQAHGSRSDTDSPQHHHHTACCQAPVFAHHSQDPLVLRLLTITIHEVLRHDLTPPTSPVFELEIPPRVQSIA